MAMSKKDYVAIAAVFRGQVETKADPKRVQMIRILAHGIADVMARDNSRFDRARFLQACGVML
jgi:hypothetical protein